MSALVLMLVHPSVVVMIVVGVMMEVVTVVFGDGGTRIGTSTHTGTRLGTHTDTGGVVVVW